MVNTWMINWTFRNWTLKPQITGLHKHICRIEQHPAVKPGILELQTTILSWMIGETTIFHVKIWFIIQLILHHLKYRGCFQVPRDPIHPTLCWSESNRASRRREKTTHLKKRDTPLAEIASKISYEPSTNSPDPRTWVCLCQTKKKISRKWVLQQKQGSTWAKANMDGIVFLDESWMSQESSNLVKSLVNGL